MIVVDWYNGAKSAWSRLNDWIKRGERRSPIPLFESPEVLGQWMQKYVPYTGDPGNGAGDFYLHPERLQAAIEREVADQLHVDCDDWATYAFVALQLMGARPLLFTLFDPGISGCHVICGYATPQGFGAIDTNGHRKLPNLTPKTLCDEWTRIYADKGYRYTDARPTAYPF